MKTDCCRQSTNVDEHLGCRKAALLVALIRSSPRHGRHSTSSRTDSQCKCGCSVLLIQARLQVSNTAQERRMSSQIAHVHWRGPVRQCGPVRQHVVLGCLSMSLTTSLLHDVSAAAVPVHVRPHLLSFIRLLSISCIAFTGSIPFEIPPAVVGCCCTAGHGLQNLQNSCMSAENFLLFPASFEALTYS